MDRTSQINSDVIALDTAIKSNDERAALVAGLSLLAGFLIDVANIAAALEENARVNGVQAQIMERETRR